MRNFRTGITLSIKKSRYWRKHDSWTIQQVSHQAGLEHSSSDFRPQGVSRCCYRWKNLRRWAESGWSQVIPWKITCQIIFLYSFSQIKIIFQFRVQQIKEIPSVLSLVTSSIFSPQWAWKYVAKSHYYLWLISRNPLLPQTKAELQSKAGLWHSGKHMDMDFISKEK